MPSRAATPSEDHRQRPAPTARSSASVVRSSEAVRLFLLEVMVFSPRLGTVRSRRGEGCTPENDPI